MKIFEVGSQIPLSVRAADDAGQITQVEFFVDNESIGKVDQRYDGVLYFNLDSY